MTQTDGHTVVEDATGTKVRSSTHVDEVPGPDASKADWRRWARARRAEVDLGRVAPLVVEGLRAWLATRPPTVVVSYLALPDEVDLDGLRVDGRHRWGLVRTAGAGSVLTVHDADGPRERHPYGMEQPAADAASIDVAAVGVVLVPGLAFDTAGGRLGRGGGFYDRFLATLGPADHQVDHQVDHPGHRPAFVGVVPGALVVHRLPTLGHDVAMDHLADESGVRSVEGHGR